MNKIAVLSVLAYGAFDPYSVNLFAGRADQMEEVCKRLNANMMEECPDTPIQDYLDESRQAKIVDDMLKNALLSKEAAQRLIEKILEVAQSDTLIAAVGVFETDSVDTLGAI